MAKTKTVYICQQCGFESPKWLGRCPSCNAWNTFTEEVIAAKEVTRPAASMLSSANKPRRLSEISTALQARIDTCHGELNRILGGGMVPGSVILLGGEPGIGKSTLALQLALKMNQFSTLYVSGEESEQQIKLRAERLGTGMEHCLVLPEVNLENILEHAAKEKPGLLIVDSIQTLSSEMLDSSAGSVPQIKECASRLLRYGKQTATPVLLIGHITKDGSLAGPKVLEHIVDVVLQFEGDPQYMYRVLRATKNRFGSTSELGIFEMRENGLSEVLNPSEILISHRDENLSGVAVAATLNGLRPLLIETQALVSSAVYGTPQRSATGIDFRRLNMLLAVLEKRAGFKLASKDVFLNIAGGIKVDDPALDLAIVGAILSSTFDIPVNPNICLTGEIGLSGEVRPVIRIEQRISEAEKLGFDAIIVPAFNTKNISSRHKIKIHPVHKVEQLSALLFGKKNQSMGN